MGYGALGGCQGVAMPVLNCYECLSCCYVVARVFLSGLRCSRWLPGCFYAGPKVF